MKKILALGLFIALFLACENTTPPQEAATNTLQATEPVSTPAPPPVQTLRGMYKNKRGQRTFYDCADGKTYRVLDETKTLDSLYREACEPTPYEGESVYAVVQGRLENTQSGSTLRISQIDTLRTQNRRNTCMPYEFWCVGTEPFWSLLISEAEGGMFFKMLGEERGKVYPWAKPSQQGNTWTYKSSNTATGEKIEVIIRKEFCSDGMSDQRYEYSVSLQIGEQKLIGCAAK